MPEVQQILTEPCPKTGVSNCPYLHDYEIDDIQGCKLCCGAHTEPSLMPTECPLDIKDEIKAAITNTTEQIRQQERERVEKAIKALSKINIGFEYKPDTYDYECNACGARGVEPDKIRHLQLCPARIRDEGLAELEAE